MVPTPLGKTLMDFTLKHFPDLFAFQFTAGMESRLDKIAEGSENWKLVLGDTWNSYKDRITELKTAGTGASSENSKRREFAGGLIAVMSGKGPLILKEGVTKEETVFYGWPTSIKRGFAELTENEALAFVASVVAAKQGDTVGEWNGHAILKKKGPYGFYAEWNGIRHSYKTDTEFTELCEQLKNKTGGTQDTDSSLPTFCRVIGDYTIKRGPYGLFFYRGGAAKRIFAKFPAGLVAETIGVADCAAAYKLAADTKASSGGRGGFRGRGRGRGH